MKDLLFYIFAFAIGAGAIVQGAINAQLKTSLSTSSLFAAFVSVLVSTLFLGVLLLFNWSMMPNGNSIQTTSVYKWTGGIIGAIFVVGIVIVGPKIGMANTFGWIVAGQMCVSLLLDHFGSLGLPENQISWPKVIGAMMIIGGVVLIGQAKK